MALRGPADVPFVLLGGRDIMGALLSLEDSHEAVLERTDTLGDAWEEHTFVGIRTANLSLDAFYDDGAFGLHAALSTGPGISRILSYGLEGTATGAAFVGWEGALEVNYHRQMELGALTKARATFRTNGAVDQGKILRTWKVASATGLTTATPVNWGVSTTGGVGYLQYQTSDLTTVSGEAEVFVMHSSDDVTYATILTFACSTAGVGADRKLTTAVIEQYTAVSYSTNAVSGSTGISFFVGLARGGTS